MLLWQQLRILYCYGFCHGDQHWLLLSCQFNRCCFDSNQVPSLQILPWQQTLIITYFHVNLIDLALTATTKVPQLRLLQWWLTLTTTCCQVCSMNFALKPRFPKVYLRAVKIPACALTSISVWAKGQGFDGHKWWTESHSSATVWK